jgi:hypothetical protein
MTVMGLVELRRAYQAAAAGEFAVPRTSQAQNRPRQAAEWVPGASEAVRVVLGAHAGAGASTVALAMASAAGQARVVECCTVAASGFAGAADAELGVTPAGWAQGSRGPVLIERHAGHLASPEVLPVPEPTDKPLTVVDASFDAAMLADSLGWLSDLVRSQPAVVVARPTVPGLRRLECVLDVLGQQRCTPVLVGVAKRWPRWLEQSAGPRVRDLHTANRIVTVPFDASLAQMGLTPDALPAPIVAAGRELITN